MLGNGVTEAPMKPLLPVGDGVNEPSDDEVADAAGESLGLPLTAGGGVEEAGAVALEL